MTGSFAMEQFEFHHFGVAVRELRQAIAFFGNLFGYELRSGPFEDPRCSRSAHMTQKTFWLWWPFYLPSSSWPALSLRSEQPESTR